MFLLLQLINQIIVTRLSRVLTIKVMDDLLVSIVLEDGHSEPLQIQSKIKTC